MKKVLGIIGLGAMGFPMASHLIENGFELYTVVRSERSRNKAESLGIHILEAYKDLSKYTSRVLLMVSNYDQCKECLLGEEGVLSTLHNGIIILSSTVSPDEAKKLSAACSAGVTMIDAPVSGGAIGAENGSLTAILAGGDTEISACADIFSSYCKKTVQVGNEVGQAQAIKAVNQMLVSIHMVATAEAMALTSAMGIDAKAMQETICDCSGSSNIFQSRMPKLINGDFSARASLEILEKDTQICMSLAQSCGIPCYLTKLCHELFSQTPRSNDVAEDACAVVRMYK